MGKVAPIRQRETPREVGACGSQRMGALEKGRQIRGPIAAGTSYNTCKSWKARETTELPSPGGNSETQAVNSQTQVPTPITLANLYKANQEWHKESMWCNSMAHSCQCMTKPTATL